VRVAELREGLLAEYRIVGRAKSTIRQAGVRFNRLLEHFGPNADAAEFTYQTVSEYAAKRLETAARATVKAELSTLKKAMRILERSGRLKVPPFPSISVRNARQGFLEEHEFRAILAELAPELKALAEFLFWSGWRSSDAIGLLWSDVDFAEGTMTISASRTKNQEPKTWPFAVFPPLKSLMERQQAATLARSRELGRVIPTVFWRLRTGQPIQNFRIGWNGAAKRAGYPAKRPHDCRRTTCRRMDRAGMRRKVQMQILGLKTESIHERYNIRNRADDIEEVKKLSRFIADEPCKDG
jgi:integrase